MKAAFGSNVSQMGLFWRVVAAEVMANASNFEMCAEFVARDGYAKESRKARAAGSVHIQQVCRLIDIAQILDSIVATIAVDVIDDADWPLIMDVQPSETMGQIAFAPDMNAAITPAMVGASNIARPNACALRIEPMKYSR